MNCSLVVNSIGLALDFIGAIIFAKGIIISDKTIDKFSSGTTYGGKVTGLEKMLKENRKEAYIGLVLILLGFFLQLLSQFL